MLHLPFVGEVMLFVHSNDSSIASSGSLGLRNTTFLEETLIGEKLPCPVGKSV